MTPGAWLKPLLRGGGGPLSLTERLTRASDPAFDLLFEDSSAGLIALDRAGRILRVNAVLRRMVAGRVDLTEGAPALAVIAEPDRARLWKALQPALQGRNLAADLRARIEAAAAEAPGAEALGAELAEAGTAVALSVVPIREADGTVSGLLLRLTDLAPQRRLEARLAHSQKLQAVGELAGGIAHDFNNLLTAVLGAADLVLARGDTLDFETRDDVGQIRRSAQRGAALVRQLLAFGRQQTLQPRIVAVNEAVTDLSHLITRLLGERVSLLLDLETPGRRVRVDPTQFDQVLMNLAVNARDAMPGGGTLTLRTGHLTLYRPLLQGAETIPPGRYVLVEVQDTGIGIPADVLPRICDPFFTTKRQQGGSGLGLSTVHGIVRQSEGVLTIESEAGQGTRVRIYLPRHEEPDRASQAAPAEAIPNRIATSVAAPGASNQGAGRVVLLVDDEEPVRRMARRALEKKGWLVLAAGCGDEALRLLHGLPDGPGVSVLVSDVVMPGMEGPALVRAVRDRHPGLPAILVSGYAAATLREGSNLNDVTFMPKPYTLSGLVTEVERIAAPGSLGPVRPHLEPAAEP